MKKAYVNGKIFTSDGENLYADAMIVEDGRIIWIGKMDEMPSDVCERADLGGKRVIPGFVDAHMHPVMLADFSRQIACLPPKINSIAELIAEIARVRKEKQPGEWIEGWGYDEGKFAEHRSPNRYDLDKGSPDMPVFLIRSCEHIRCVNSKALEIAGITRDTPDPQGGEIERDENGEPTGVLKENARDLVLPYMPETTKEDTVDSLVELGELLTSQGIVAVTDMGNLHAGGNYELYKAAEKKGFRQRVSLYYMWDYFMNDPEFILTPELMDRESRVRIAGLKLIGDGSVSGRTAWMYDPYLDGDDTGLAVYSDESMEKAIAYAKNYGCQISVHAMGGRAIDRVVDRVYEEDDWTDGSFPFVRVEHLTEPTEKAMKKAAEKGIAFATQPIFAYCEIETYRKNIGTERIKKEYPIRTILDRGVNLCLSTDAPATSWAVPSDPFPNIKSAVTRTAYDGTDLGQDQRLDMETALMLYTAAAAEVSGFRGIGKLKAGYEADFVVLSDDILEIDPEKVDTIKVDQTYISGEKVFQS